MTPEQRIDANLESVLKEAGASMNNYTDAQTSRMREAMRKIMSKSYIQGSNDNYNAMMVKYEKR